MAVSLDNGLKACKIKDIYLAAFLSSLGFKRVMVATSPDIPVSNLDFDSDSGLESPQVHFLFPEEGLEQQLTLAYFDNISIRIGSQDYQTSINKLFLSLKQLCREMREARSH